MTDNFKNNILKTLFDIKPVDKTGRVDVGKIYSVRPVVNLATKKAPTDATSYKLVNSVGAARSVSSPVSHPVYSLSQPTLKSSEKVDNQKPYFGEVVGSVDGTGLGHNSDLSSAKSGRDPALRRSSPTVAHDMLRHANFPHKQSSLLASSDERNLCPSALRVATQDQHYTPSMVRSSYQLSRKKQNHELATSNVRGTFDVKTLLEKYLNSKLNIGRELKAIGAKVEKGGPDAKLRYRPILAKPKSGVTTLQVVEPINDFVSPVDFRSQDCQAILSQINQRTLPETDDWFVGEPRKIDPVEYWGQRSLMTSTEFLDSAKRGQETTPRQVGVTCEVPASAEIESWTRYARSKPTAGLPTGHTGSRLISLKTNIYNLSHSILCIFVGRFNNKVVLTTGIIGFSALVLTLFGQYGISLKNEIVKEGNSAVASLEQAEKSLKVFDFEAASGNFTWAYKEFSKAGESLNFMGASITSLFAESLDGFDNLTAGKLGTGKLKLARNIVEAGKLLAGAGKSMSEVVSSLAQTGTILRLTTSDVRGTSDVKNIFNDLKKSLLISSKNLSKASALLSDVSFNALPEDKKEAFSEFQSKLPELEKIVSDGIGYADFLESFLGVELTTSEVGSTSDVTKKYLVLFQNDSELRPTGGFPGTYAVIMFKDGQLLDIVVDDVYNLDGQLKENIIPPEPLQHITPTWGMRDANWFIDFSVSAQKVMEFFKKEAGYEVDGVITISPRMISDILKVVGPIEMPEYGTVINDENFVSTIQEEIEYGDNRQQPKKIVMDMTPKLLEKISSADSNQWLEIFNVFMSGLDKKDILMYFQDLGLENFVAEKGFGGLIKQARTYTDSTQIYTDTDYLMVTFTNVKGSKTDRVTDNSIKLNLQPTMTYPFDKLRILNLSKGNLQPVIKHKLTITRQHNGGDTKYGFYNRQNPAYVRVLVPKGAELISVSGNSAPDFKPLISYSGDEFKKDKDLFKLESSFEFDRENNAWVYEESGKTGFAFWMITDPGEEKTVELEYVVPFASSEAEGFSNNNYGIYIQKQPGLEVDNFEFSAGGDYVYNGEFNKDLELRFRLE